MKTFVKLIVPALALGLIAAVPRFVKGDDTPAATQPSKPAGTVTVHVVDSEGKPVANANVTLAPAPEKGKKKKDPTAAKQKPTPVASGKTDADGTLTLTNIPEGSYRARAKVKGGGTGHEDVIVSAVAGAADPTTVNPPVTITLQPKKNKAATTQPGN